MKKNKVVQVAEGGHLESDENRTEAASSWLCVYIIFFIRCSATASVSSSSALIKGSLRMFHPSGRTVTKSSVNVLLCGNKCVVLRGKDSATGLT